MVLGGSGSGSGGGGGGGIGASVSEPANDEWYLAAVAAGAAVVVGLELVHQNLLMMSRTWHEFRTTVVDPGEVVVMIHWYCLLPDMCQKPQYTSASLTVGLLLRLLLTGVLLGQTG